MPGPRRPRRQRRSRPGRSDRYGSAPCPSKLAKPRRTWIRDSQTSYSSQYLDRDRQRRPREGGQRIRLSVTPPMSPTPRPPRVRLHPDGFTKQRPGWTPNNARLDQCWMLGLLREPPDGQSADGSGALQFPLRSSRPALRAASGQPTSPYAQSDPARGARVRPCELWGDGLTAADGPQ